MGKQVTTGKAAPIPAVQEVRGSPATEGLNLTLTGVRFDATLDTDTPNNYTPGVDIEIQGVIFEAKDFTDGDYLELQIIMPGDPETVVATYAKTLYVKPSGSARLITDTTAKIPAGLLIRAIYTSVATDGPMPVVYLDYLIWK